MRVRPRREDDPPHSSPSRGLPSSERGPSAAASLTSKSRSAAGSPAAPPRDWPPRTVQRLFARRSNGNSAACPSRSGWRYCSFRQSVRIRPDRWAQVFSLQASLAGSSATSRRAWRAPNTDPLTGRRPFQFLGRQGHRFRERWHGAGGSSVVEYPFRLVRTVVAWASEPVAVLRHQVMRADTGTKYRTAFTRQW